MRCLYASQNFLSCHVKAMLADSRTSYHFWCRIRAVYFIKSANNPVTLLGYTERP